LPTSKTLLIDDRLLVAFLVGAPLTLPEHDSLLTTTYWYYRACRAAVSGGSGQLSGPFRALNESRRGDAIAAMLRLPDNGGLPDPRRLVPEMVAVQRRHPHLNLLNVEAAAAANLFVAHVVLSPAAAEGVLPAVLDNERIAWDTLAPFA
jgi:hypothetical protein